MTPLLILIMRVEPTVAVGSDLVYAAITKVFGAFQHHKNGNVDTHLAWRISVGSVPGALLGAYTMSRMSRHNLTQTNSFVKHLLGIMLLFVAAAILMRGLPAIKEFGKKLRLGPDAKRGRWGALFGVFLGYLVGLTSVGSGTLFGVLLIVVFGLTPKNMVGTDVFHAAVLSSAAAVGHIYSGNVDWKMVGSILIGSIPGILISSRLAGKMPDHLIRPILATVLLFSGYFMLIK